MKLPIGYDNFRDIFVNKLNWVDKSLLIKDLLDDPSTQIAVITRPRRFGKTLNLSMLHYFFAAEVLGEKTAGLFDDLAIGRCEGNYLQYQGQYPVIFLTLKGIQESCFKNAYEKLCHLLSRVYAGYDYLLSSPRLNEKDKADFQLIRSGSVQTISKASLEDALQNLTYYLYQHHGKKVWLLVDEYDSPIQAAYEKNYYPEMISLMRNFFGAAFKTNPYLNRAVVTGILRIAKESLFSDVNNLKVYSLFQQRYSQYFGFTENEVSELLQQACLQNKAEEIQCWYNGYQVGNTVIYNPWSIVNCITEHGELKPYWVNTSGNELIHTLITQSSGSFKAQFEQLLADQPIEEFIDEQMGFGDLHKNETAVWSLLLMAGYLKILRHRWEEQGALCLLAIPNREVRILYRQIIENWLADHFGIKWYNTFLDHLLTGNFKAFSDELKQVMENIVSTHDTARDPEIFYHGLIIGLTASLYKNPNYEIHSNRESGYGRYDYLILSHDKNKPTLVLEFKRIDPVKDPEQRELKLEQAAQEALAQIEQQHYLAQARQRGCTHILKIGLAFCGKYFKLQTE